jgi:hypothetical protein
MKELLEYRVKMIARLSEAAQEFHTVCKAIGDPSTKVGEAWTLHQIASLTRDVENLVYGARIHQTLNENNPEFQNFEADEWIKTHYKPEELLTDILDEFLKNVDELCKTLRGLRQEDWSRESRHETMGGELTLQLWVERSLAHIEEHLQLVKKA